MEQSQKSLSAGSAPSASNPYLSVSMHPEIKYRPMPNPVSVYVPLKSLTKETIRSVVSTVHQPKTNDWYFSRRTLLSFLLAIDNNLTQIERNPHANHQFDGETIAHASKVRRWLAKEDRFGCVEQIEWDRLRADYRKMAAETDAGQAKNFGVDLKDVEPYYELTIKGVHADVNRSREYMARFRSHGWDPKELKVYWNAKQVEDLCPKDGINAKRVLKTSSIDDTTSHTEKVQVEKKDEVGEKDLGTSPSEPFLHDPSDADAVQALYHYPVCQRNHAGKITFVNKGIEEAVFDTPENAQLIVLNFANERSPGGGYLQHARAQEETLLYNSDGYRALLDLKYGRMGGGYAIPEFGTAYVRDIRFFNSSTQRTRRADLLVSAAYCLSSSSELYENPTWDVEWLSNNVAKFRALMAAAVANTVGDGSNTYLLLGPIGTGAFGNDPKEVARVFHQVLSSQMMSSAGPIRNAFGNIWFVSTDAWKNKLFEKVFEKLDLPEAD